MRAMAKDTKTDKFDNTDFTYRPDQNDDPGKYGTHPGDDLPKKGSGASLETLADYLSQLTQGKVEQGPQPSSPNAYTIAPVAKDPGVITDGTTALTKPNTTQAKGEWFTSNLTFAASPSSLEYSNSGIWDDLGDVLDKTSQGKGPQSGNSLLADVAPTNIQGMPFINLNPNLAPVQDKISAVLQKNRFHPGPDSPYRDGGEYTKGFYTIEQKFGEYRGDKYTAPGQPIVGAGPKVATESQLKKIGKNLMINATGHGPMVIEIPFFDDLEIPGPDVDTPFLGDTLLLPSPLQLGIMKVGTEKLRPGDDVGGSVQTGQVGGARKFDGVFHQADRSSYGQLNSPWEPFDGPAPMAMAVTALAAMIAMLGLGFILDIIPLGSTAPGDGGNDGEDPKGSAAPHELEKGSSMTGDQDSAAQTLIRYLGIPQTSYDIGDCISKGIAAFFGMGSAPGPGDDASSLMGGAINVVQSPGYYVGVVRNAIRDAEQVGRATSQADFKSISGAIAAVIAVVDAIATSATFRLLMVLATLGNIVLDGEEGGFNPILAGGDLDSWQESHGWAENPRARAGKIRASAFDSRLAYRHSAVPSLYLLPTPQLNALNVNMASAGGGRADIGLLLNKLGPGNSRGGGEPGDPIVGVDANDVKGYDQINSMWATERPDPELVHAFENHLEMEYVPFYFQDLRTNEFISLHAFIESLSDSWAAEYNSSSGIGRMDPVMTHNKTTRTIALTFMLVSTNEDDFDIMWWTVNKLVSMLYPQWSAGEVMRGANEERFIMPFSQVPTASPMVRLRVGDVIKSNYSDPAIARLFGADAMNTKESQTFRVGDAAKQAASEAKALADHRSKMNDMMGFIMEIHEGGWSSGADGTAVMGEKIIVTERFYRGKKQSPPRGGILTVDGKERDDSELWTVVKKSGLPASGDQVVEVEEVGEWIQTLTRKKSSYEHEPFMSTVKSAFGGEKSGVTGGHTKKEAEDKQKKEGGAISEKITKTKYRVTRIKYKVTVLCNFGALGDKVPVVVWGRGKRTKHDMKWIHDTALKYVGPPPGSEAATSAGGLQDFFDFKGNKNPIIRAFRSAKGRGLAGFITSMNMDWNEATWETEKLGKRAPKSLKISMNFAPVHDIPMGLDYNGWIRAPAYPVGDITNAAFGEDAGQLGYRFQGLRSNKAQFIPSGKGDG